MRRPGALSQRSRNLLSSAILLTVGLYWFLEGGTYGPLSRLYPRVLAAIVVVLALLLGGLTLAGNGPVIRIARGDAAERHRRSGTLIAAMVIWTLLIPVVGLLPASVVGVVAMGVITFRAHAGTLRAIIIALAAVLAFYFLFQQLLNVYFPMGLFG